MGFQKWLNMHHALIQFKVKRKNELVNVKIQNKKQMTSLLSDPKNKIIAIFIAPTMHGACYTKQSPLLLRFSKQKEGNRLGIARAHLFCIEETKLQTNQKKDKVPPNSF